MPDPLDEALAQMDERLDPEEDSPGETPSEPEQTELEVAAEAEPETEEPEDEPPDEAAAALLAGKYRSPEELERAYKELESRLGTQGNELAEYRRMVEEQYQQPAPAQINQPVVDWFEQQVDQNPYGAAEWARQNDPSGILYNQAMDSWYDVAPRQAAAYERQLELGQVKQEFQQQIQKTNEPLEAQEMARAFRAAAERHTDVDDSRLGELLQSAAQNAPAVTQSLIATAHASDYETRVQVFEGLIALAKGQQAGEVAQAVQSAADQDAAKTRQLKQAGGVATQSQAVQPGPVDPDEQWLRDNFDKYLAPAS